MVAIADFWDAVGKGCQGDVRKRGFGDVISVREKESDVKKQQLCQKIKFLYQTLFIKKEVIA